MADDAPHDLRRRGLLYGRRQNHTLSQRQQALMDAVLPRLAVPVGAPIDLARLFAPGIKDYALEVGFGGGEHLRALARANPTRGFIGCEPFVNGMAQMVAHIEDEGIANIRLHHGDAREVLSALPDASLAALYVLFPDPWPKKRHWKRRFVGPDTLPALARVLKKGAALRVASDIEDYVRWSLIHIVPGADFEWTAVRPADWRVRPADWPATRYEAKALREGRTPSYLQFARC